MYAAWQTRQAELVQALQPALLPLVNAFQLPNDIVQAPMGIVDSTTVYERYLDKTILVNRV